MSSAAKAPMKDTTKLELSSAKKIKLKQWAWFVGLYFASLCFVLSATYCLKYLIKIL